MDVKPIKTEADYEAVLAEIERLFDAELGTPEGDRLEALATLVELYEDEHYDLPLPDPGERCCYFIQFFRNSTKSG